MERSRPRSWPPCWLCSRSWSGILFPCGPARACGLARLPGSSWDGRAGRAGLSSMTGARKSWLCSEMDRASGSSLAGTGRPQATSTTGCGKTGSIIGRLCSGSGALPTVSESVGRAGRGRCRIKAEKRKRKMGLQSPPPYSLAVYSFQFILGMVFKVWHAYGNGQ